MCSRSQVEFLGYDNEQDRNLVPDVVECTLEIVTVTLIQWLPLNVEDVVTGEYREL